MRKKAEGGSKMAAINSRKWHLSPVFAPVCENKQTTSQYVDEKWTGMAVCENEENGARAPYIV